MDQLVRRCRDWKIYNDQMQELARKYSSDYSLLRAAKMIPFVDVFLLKLLKVVSPMLSNRCPGYFSSAPKPSAQISKIPSSLKT